MSDAPWWHGAVGYEVYVRSFADSDGDGVGDLPGVRSRVDHLAWLGVDIVWVTPFYPSPMADHGYDVADYTAVDPMFGSVGDVEELVDAVHAVGLQLVIDLVPNHTSSQHPWFRSSRSGRASRHRDWYVWRDPAPGGGPPNNWQSNFGGPAWTLDDRTGQYYLHRFLPEQPDLDWRNPEVRDAFDEILRFWLDRGVDGFRIDVAHLLLFDEELRDNPAGGGIRHDLDQPGVTDIYRRWNEIVAPYDALLLGEVYLLEPERLTRYVEAGDGLHSAFCFAALRTPWDAAAIRDTLARGVAAGTGALSWPLSSHDDPHAATRFGGGAAGRRRSLAYLTVLAGLPGIPFLFQGDELGLPDGEVPPGRFQDPAALRNPGSRGRDGSRTPLPWEPEPPGFGFTTASEPWLPFGGRRPGDSVAAQRAYPGSHLHRVRRLLEVRRGSDDLRSGRALAWLDAGTGLVAYRRGDTVVALNAGDAGARLDLPGGSWRVAFSSLRPRAGRDGGAVAAGSLRLEPDEAAILVVR